MILQLLIASHEELNVQLIEEEAQIGVAWAPWQVHLKAWISMFLVWEVATIA
jgi:hypothetical protein